MRPFTLVVVVAVGLNLCNAQAPLTAPSTSTVPKYYSGNGGFSNNCPINECATFAASCTTGQYLNGCGGGTVQGSCGACTNTPPANAAYTTNGGLNATGCTWKCGNNYDQVGQTCVLKQCASNGFALTVSNSQYADSLGGGDYPTCNFVCKAGYSGTTVTGARGPTACGQCAPGGAAAAGSSTCTTCSPGFFALAGAGTCSPCVAPFFSTTTGAGSCSSCLNCATGQYKLGCGGASAGTCQNCDNTAYTAP